MFQDKTAFLEYPSRNYGGRFDRVRIEFHLDRVRGQMDLRVFSGGREVAKFYSHVPSERLSEQLGIEQMFADQNDMGEVKYEVRVHGDFPPSQQN
ncbi:hypothetical protein HYV87_00560 [Candidatus Woesearchaeota archaeon]|nr:hypothetical protein [Candidatus Woesearchaeota archaeon]MBI2581604.1 hypothetical protein [Candidatus Woesearchaeota archaeon]